MSSDDDDAELYIRRIREPVQELIEQLTGKRAEYATIVYGLVKCGAFQIAKNYIDWIEKKTSLKIDESLNAFFQDGKTSVPLIWKCEHGHTKESHPRCYRRAQQLRLKINRIKESHK